MKRKFSLALTVALVLCFAFPSGVNAALPAKTAASATLHLELETYSTNTTRILAYWENTGDVPVTFGEPFRLEKKEGSKWVAVKMDVDINYNAIGYDLEPGEVRKHVYNISMYSSQLKSGEYRISAVYTHSRAPGDYTSYTARKVFKIVDAKKFKGVSELDAKGLEKYRDITPYSVFQNTSARIYRHTDTQESILVYKGNQYLIAADTGGWGVIDAEYLKADGKTYIIYTYSWGNGRNKQTLRQARRSHIGVFSLTDAYEVYTSQGFYRDDIGLQPSETSPLLFSVYRMQLTANASGVQTTELDVPLGTLTYNNGTFSFDGVRPA